MTNPNKIKVTISNKLGLHARASAQFVKEASRYQAEIFVAKAEQKVNGKSILGLLMLAASCGTEIEIHADGPDAKLALENLKNLVQAGFYEDKNKGENK